MALLQTFANAVGSIPLSALDSNFANLNSNTAYAITAGTVTSNDQPNITSLGSLANLTVSGLNFVGVTTFTNNNVSANIALSSSTSYNIIINNANSVINITPPAAANGQITAFTLAGNSTANLHAVSGIWVPPFDGATAAGTAVKYVFSSGTWYKIA